MKRWAILGAMSLVLCAAASSDAQQRWHDATARTVEFTANVATPPSRALERSLIPSPQLGREGNAAPLYYQAMLSLSVLPAEDQRTLDEMSRAEFGRMDLANGTRVLTRIEPVFGLIELASCRDECDWATPLPDRGVGVLVPEAPHLRLMGIALAARARMQIMHGDRDAGLRTIGAGLALAKHAAKGPTIVQSVLALFIAERMADQIDAYLQTSDAPSLYWALVELGDTPVDVRAAVRSERFMLEYELPQLEEILSGATAPETALRETERLLHPMRTQGVQPRSGWRIAAEAAALYPKGRALMISAGATPQDVDRLPIAYVTMRYHLQRYLELRDELFKWLPLPWWQSRHGLIEAQANIDRAKQRGEGASLLEMIPDVVHLMRTAAQIERRFAMLRTIESLRLYAGEHRGEVPSTLDGLMGYPAPLDVATGRMFDYQVNENVVTLRADVMEPAGNWAGSAQGRIEYRVKITASRSK